MDNLEELIDILAKEKDRKQVRKLLEELLTPAELADVSKRWYILKELYRNKPQRKIAKEMEVSLCKITRGARILKKDDSKFKSILSDMFDSQN